MTFPPGIPSCNPHSDPPIFGDCWYNCTLDDIAGEDKKHRLRKVIFLADDCIAFTTTCLTHIVGQFVAQQIIGISKINMLSNPPLPLILFRDRIENKNKDKGHVL